MRDFFRLLRERRSYVINTTLIATSHVPCTTGACLRRTTRHPLTDISTRLQRQRRHDVYKSAVTQTHRLNNSIGWHKSQYSSLDLSITRFAYLKGRDKATRCDKNNPPMKLLQISTFKRRPKRNTFAVILETSVYKDTLDKWHRRFRTR